MLMYYRNFIATGDPNGEGLPEWPASDGSSMVQEFGDSIAYVQAPYLKTYEILDEMYGYK